MEGSSDIDVRSYLPRRSWYRRTWGEALLAFLFAFFLFSGYVFWNVYRELTTSARGSMVTSEDRRRMGQLVTNALLADIKPEDRPTLGHPDAPVTIVEFADFACPSSAVASHTVRELAIQYPTRFRLVYRQFPIVERNEDAMKAAEASMCVFAQGKFWGYHDRLYASEGVLDSATLERLAAASGVDIEAFQTCMSNGTYRDAVTKDFELGQKMGIKGTPTFYVNGARVSGAIPRDQLEELIMQYGQQ